MSDLEELLKKSANIVNEYKVEIEMLKNELKYKIAEADDVRREAEERKQEAAVASTLFAPPGYIMLTTSTDYGDHTPYVSWFPTLEDANLYQRWCNATSNEWVHSVRDGKKIIALGEWIQKEHEDWGKPPEENASGKEVVLRDLEEYDRK